MEGNIQNLAGPAIAPQSGNRRCRSYSVEYKLSILKEISKPGASVAAVARENDLNANMVFKWRQLYRQGKLAPNLPQFVHDFVPVRLSDDAQSEKSPALPSADHSSQVEIALPNGVCVRTDAGIEAQSLHRLLITVGKLP